MRRFALLLVLLLAMSAARAQEGAQTILHLLDYVGVDYGGAVENGKVKSEDEYKEMLEFTSQAHTRMQALPENAQKSALVSQAAKLAQLVKDKADASAVAELSGSVRASLIRIYGVQVAPRHAPDLARAAQLYAANCAACHGAQGKGDGPAAKGLDPAPANFHDRQRMAERSLYGLYNTITLGVGGTSMSAFGQLSEDERWALAFYTGSLGLPAEEIKKGEALWKQNAAHATFANLASITSLSADERRKRDGADAALVQGYLRTHPEALEAGKASPLSSARDKLAASLAAYQKGDRAAALDQATSSYLDGFELVENALDNLDKPLRLEIEREMLAVRGMITRGAPASELSAQVAKADALLAAAEQKLDSGELSSQAAFSSALIILLREGTEAIVLLAAIIAFIRRAGRSDAMGYVHAGWIAALALGALTWVVATYLIGISGANRELTEGVTALLAAAVLLYVGFWLHGRTQAHAWSSFLRGQVGAALERKALWAIAGVSFLTVYREIFEVILFYEALWAQAGEAGQRAVVAGIAVAAVLLALFSWAFLKYSVRLPLGPFFKTMSALIVILAVVFAGQGVAALQEGGYVGLTHVPFVNIPVLGIYPTLESLGAQLLVVVLVAFGYWAAGRGAQQKAAATS